MENPMIEDLLADIFARKDGKAPPSSNNRPQANGLYRPNYQRMKTAGACSNAPFRGPNKAPGKSGDDLDVHEMMRAYLK